MYGIANEDMTCQQDDLFKSGSQMMWQDLCCCWAVDKMGREEVLERIERSGGSGCFFPDFYPVWSHGQILLSFWFMVF